MNNNEKSKTLFTNVKVWDGLANNPTAPTKVLVEGNLIKSIGPDVQVDAEAMVIDGGGGILIPGLIDAHWHVTYSQLGEAEALQSDVEMFTIKGVVGAEPTLMRGFTTVRDMGGNTFSIKKAIDRGMIVGPRIYPSGPPIAQTSGHFDFRGPNDVPANPADPLSYFERNAVVMIADGVPEMIKRVREVLRLGATQIKLATGAGVSSAYDPLDVAEFTYEEIKAAVDIAATWNTYVAVHVFTDKAIQNSVRAGVKSIEHGFLMNEETMQMLVDNDVWYCPQPLLNDEDAFSFPDPFTHQKWVEVTDGTDNVYRLAKKLGVKLAWGTDFVFTPELNPKQGKFLAKMKRWFTPHEILKMATYDNAQLVKLCGPRDPYPGKLGVVEEGALADLILVDGNPLENIDLVVDPDSNFKVIMKDGQVYKNTVN
jgi:imidazolonepropionase-like amidohydrolase